MTKKKSLVFPIEEPEPGPDDTPGTQGPHEAADDIDSSKLWDPYSFVKDLLKDVRISPSSGAETVQDEQIQNKQVQGDRVRVFLDDLTGKKRYEVEITTEVELQRLIPALIDALGLPTTDNSGQPVTYYLTFADRRLLEDETLASARVLNDATLTLVSELKTGEVLSYDPESKRAVEAFAEARIETHHMDPLFVVNEEYELTVILKVPTEFMRVTEQLSDADVVETDVVVRTADMEVFPHWVQKVKLLRGRGSDLLEFRLIPREVGQKQILVEFYYQRHWLAQVQFEVDVVEAQDLVPA